MKQIFSALAAEFCNGKLIGADLPITSITTDSRKIENGCMFIAIKGERFDGHSFIEQAWSLGADCVLSQTAFDVPEGKALILVEDTRAAMLRIANGYRNLFDICLVNITGSVGKTTTKDMTAAVLSQGGKTLKTEGNFNNDIGVPITLFRLEDDIKTAVVEIGMNHFGEIDTLASACEPNIGIITNVGVSHIENLGSREGILKAKCEMLPHIKKGGYAVLNADNDMLATIKGREKEFGLPENVTAVWYGRDKSNDVWANDVVSHGIDGMECTIHMAVGEIRVHITTAGEHMVQNALAAAAAGEIIGLTPEQIKNGIEGFEPTGKRMEVIRLKNGGTIINDCYNANPVSTKAAIDVLSECDGKKTAVLGDMGELGSFGAEMHREVGEYCAKKNIDHVVAIGELSKNMYNACKDKVAKAEYFATVADYIATNPTVSDNEYILVKASHFMKFEQITSILENR